MSNPGDPPPQPPQPPQPPPSPPSPPPYQPPAFTAPAPAGRLVDVDPASAGYLRDERLGWGLVLAAVGTLVMVGSLFLPWVKTRLSVLYSAGQSGQLADREEHAGLFSVIDTITDVTGPDPDHVVPGGFAELFFPILAIVLTVVCCVVALVATVGLRRAGRTHLTRALAVLIAAAAIGFAVFAYIDVGITDGADVAGTVTSAPEPDRPAESEPLFLGSDVDGDVGLGVWLGGLLLVAVGGAIGPRVVLRLPPGSSPDPGREPGAPLLPGTQAGYPSQQRPVALRHRTQVGAMVCMALAALLCLAGYGVLPWSTVGGDSTFADISSASRELGFGGRTFTGTYFSALGWLVLAVVLLVTVLIALGLKPSGVNPKALRPFLAVAAIAGALVHTAAILDLADAGADLGVGAYVTTLGLALGALGALLPVRTSARVLVGPQDPAHW